MNLNQATKNALELTLSLAEALAAGDLERCADLTEQRTVAMQAFEACHRRASEPELRASHDLVTTLITSNKDLQERAESDLLDTAAEFRNRLGSVGSATPQAYQTTPQQACVDRKA